MRPRHVVMVIHLKILTFFRPILFWHFTVSDLHFGFLRRQNSKVSRLIVFSLFVHPWRPSDSSLDTVSAAFATPFPEVFSAFTDSTELSASSLR